MFSLNLRRSQIPLDDNELLLTKRALKSHLLCLGWMKMFRVLTYIFLYFCVHIYIKKDDTESNAIKIMCILYVFPSILLGTFIIMGAIQFRVLTYICLYFLVHVHIKTDDTESRAIKIMCIVFVIPSILLGTFLIMGAMQENTSLITAALWLLIITAGLDTALGVFGGIYFLKYAKRTVMFLISLIFWTLLCSFCCILCDLPIVNAYRSLLHMDTTTNNQSQPRREPLAIENSPV